MFYRWTPEEELRLESDYSSIEMWGREEQEASALPNGGFVLRLGAAEDRDWLTGPQRRHRTGPLLKPNMTTVTHHRGCLQTLCAAAEAHRVVCCLHFLLVGFCFPSWPGPPLNGSSDIRNQRCFTQHRVSVISSVKTKCSSSQKHTEHQIQFLLSARLTLVSLTSRP